MPSGKPNKSGTDRPARSGSRARFPYEAPLVSLKKRPVTPTTGPYMRRFGVVTVGSHGCQAGGALERAWLDGDVVGRRDQHLAVEGCWIAGFLASVLVTAASLGRA